LGVTVSNEEGPMDLGVTGTVEATIIIRLLLAILLGGAIGLERESRGRPAGLRTHILVCLGATIIMLASQSMALLSQSLSPAARVQVDPGRIAAGIVTGIGFLGAGAIIRIGDLVRGLTTAGCIWFVAALGIVVGEGLYSLGILATAFALIVLLALSHLERRIEPVVYRSILVLGQLQQAEAIERDTQALLEQQRIELQDVSRRRLILSEGRVELTFKIRARQRLLRGEVFRAIAGLLGVVEVQCS
jgi:putative Mg2+ transporter-C (MgtC) family protein